VGPAARYRDNRRHRCALVHRRRETERNADVIRGYQPRLRGMFTYPEPFDRT
jgi:hypothetical protein